jgi:DnaJ-class molecular chaperone
MNHMVIGYDDADRDPGTEPVECPDCKGTGQVPDDWFADDFIRCKRCKGEGVI